MKDLEFHVKMHGGSTRVFASFAEAVEMAVINSIGDGTPVDVDVIAWSRKAARAFGGDDGVETYNEDPDASIHKRITITAEDLGRIA